MAQGWYGPRDGEWDAQIEFCHEGLGRMDFATGSPSRSDIQRVVHLGDRTLKTRFSLRRGKTIEGKFEVELLRHHELIQGHFDGLDGEALGSLLTASVRAKVVTSTEIDHNPQWSRPNEERGSEGLAARLGWKADPDQLQRPESWQPPFEPWCYLEFSLPGHIPFEVREERGAECDHYHLQRKGNPQLSFDIDACKKAPDTGKAPIPASASTIDYWYLPTFTLRWSRHDDRRVSASFEPWERAYMAISGSTPGPISDREREELLAALTNAKLTPTPCTDDNAAFCAPCEEIETRRARVEKGEILALLLEPAPR